MPKGQGKTTMKAVMEQWEQGKLRSGSKTGPKVTSQKQAIAIGLNEAYPNRSAVSSRSNRKRGKGRMSRWATAGRKRAGKGK